MSKRTNLFTVFKRPPLLR